MSSGHPEPTGEVAAVRGGVLGAAAVAAIHRLARADDGGGPPEARAAAAASLAAADARDRGVAPEHMLVAIKAAWEQAADGPRLLDARELLNRLVTLSIDAYFRPVLAGVPPDATPPAADGRAAAARPGEGGGAGGV